MMETANIDSADEAQIIQAVLSLPHIPAPDYAKWPAVIRHDWHSPQRHDAPETHGFATLYMDGTDIAVIVTEEIQTSDWRDPMDGTLERRAGSTWTVTGHRLPSAPEIEWKSFLGQLARRPSCA